MSSKEFDIEDQDRDHVIEVVNRIAQQDIENPNLSEVYKDASVDTAVEILNNLPPKPQE